MNAIKRILGLAWLLAGPALLFYLVNEAIKKNSLPTSSANDLLQWSIIIGIFIPIGIGFMIFGFYSLKGEYDLK
jgi:hypothetical protein